MVFRVCVFVIEGLDIGHIMIRDVGVRGKKKYVV